MAFLLGSKRIKRNILEKNRHPVSSNIQAIELVARGRIQHAVIFESVAKSLINQHPELRSLIKLHEDPITSYEQYTYLHKKHMSLIPEAEAIIKEMKKSGELSDIGSKYFVRSASNLSYKRAFRILCQPKLLHI